MSDHSLIIWDASASTATNFDQVIDEVIMLREKTVEASEGMKNFLRQLQKYASESDRDNYADLYGSIYSIHEKMGWMIKAAFDLSLPDMEWEPLMVEAVAIAKKNGLMVFDEQLAMAFLPDGNILPNHRIKVWGVLKKTGKKSWVKNVADFTALGETHIIDKLSGFGFSRSSILSGYAVGCENIQDYTRKTTVGVQYCRFRFDKGRDGYFVSLQIGLRSSIVSNLCELLGFRSFENVVFNINVARILGGEGFDDYPMIEGYSELERVLNTYISFAMKILDASMDWQGLNLVVNIDDSYGIKKSLQSDFYAPHCLVIARLAGSDQFEELTVRLKVADAGINTAMVNGPQWDALVNYLRNEVKPLV